MKPELVGLLLLSFYEVVLHEVKSDLDHPFALLRYPRTSVSIKIRK